ncbi:MAG: segregation/condensation protein A [Spirochaetota bacterium]
MEPGLGEQKTVPFLVRWNNEEGGYSEGPLSILWGLIESYKVDIFNVSLSRITRDFLSFLKLSDTVSLDLGTEFTMMASNLVYMKSKALLPDPGYEEEDTEPPLPKELVDKLLEYKKFQLAGRKLSDMEKIASSVFKRESNQILDFATDEDVWLDVNLIDLIAAFNTILQDTPVNLEDPDILIATQDYSVSDKIEFISNALVEKGELHFSEIFYEENPESMDVVVSFLAILEMVKQKLLAIFQHKLFGDIKLIPAT